MNCFAKFSIILLILTLNIPSAWATPTAQQAFPSPHITQQGNQVTLSWTLPQAVQMNAHALHINADHQPIQPHVTAKTLKKDGQPMYVGFIQATLNTPPHTQQLSVYFQGCHQSGLCYPPQHRTLRLAENTPSGLWHGLGLLLIAGLFLAFTPCALPIAPIAMASICTRKQAGSWQSACSFLLGLTLSYAMLGASIYWLGLQLQLLTQTPWLLISAAVTTLLFGFALLDLVPSVTQRVYQLIQACLPKQQRSQHFHTSVMGAVTMLIATPCVAPPMLAALAWASHTQQFWPATLGVAAMGFGLGFPASCAAVLGYRLSYQNAAHALIQPLLGLLLLTLGLVFLDRVLSFHWILTFTGLWAATAIWFTWHYTKRRIFLHKIIILSTVTLCASWLYSLNSTHQQAALPSHHTLHYLSQWKQTQQTDHTTPKVIYFHANWCPTCRTIQTQVLGAPKLKKTLKKLIFLDVDLTHLTLDARSLMQHFSVIAPPTLIILNSQNHLEYKFEGDITVKNLTQALMRTIAAPKNKPNPSLTAHLK